MASNKLQVSDFDFDDIKANLKSFLQNQSEFQDYDFEGSGFAVLLDLLAYNTHYLGFNANMLANEMYLDSADIRKNIVSLAKMLGYTPTSPKSPTATIDILFNNISSTTTTMKWQKAQPLQLLLMVKLISLLQTHFIQLHRQMVFIDFQI